MICLTVAQCGIVIILNNIVSIDIDNSYKQKDSTVHPAKLNTFKRFDSISGVVVYTLLPLIRAHCASFLKEEIKCCKCVELMYIRDKTCRSRLKGMFLCKWSG
jgi:hypothetical protein